MKSEGVQSLSTRVFEAVADTFINPKRGGRETGRDRAG